MPTLANVSSVVATRHTPTRELRVCYMQNTRSSTRPLTKSGGEAVYYYVKLHRYTMHIYVYNFFVVFKKVQK
jgi:hypothetical protein